MDFSMIGDIIVGLCAFAGFSITVPVIIQHVNNVSGRIQGSRLQEQINENNAINNTSTSENKQISKQ